MLRRRLALCPSVFIPLFRYRYLVVIDDQFALLSLLVAYIDLNSEGNCNVSCYCKQPETATVNGFC
jgi:hypothetical protein